MLAYNQLPLPFQKHVVDEIGKIAGRQCLANNPDYFYMKYEIEKLIEYNRPLISKYEIFELENNKLQINFKLSQSWNFNMLIDPNLIRTNK